MKEKGASQKVEDEDLYDSLSGIPQKLMLSQDLADFFLIFFQHNFCVNQYVSREP